MKKFFCISETKQVMMFCHVHSIKQHKAGHKDEMDAKQERLLQVEELPI